MPYHSFSVSAAIVCKVFALSHMSEPCLIGSQRDLYDEVRGTLKASKSAKKSTKGFLSDKSGRLYEENESVLRDEEKRKKEEKKKKDSKRMLDVDSFLFFYLFSTLECL